MDEIDVVAFDRCALTQRCFTTYSKIGLPVLMEQELGEKYLLLEEKEAISENVTEVMTLNLYISEQNEKKKS